MSDAEKLENVDSNELNRLARSQAVVCVAFASGDNSVVRQGATCDFDNRLDTDGKPCFGHLGDLQFYILGKFTYLGKRGFLFTHIRCVYFKGLLELQISRDW